MSNKISNRKDEVIMKPITAVIIGAGSRGVNAYVPNANPGTLEIVGVADPDDFRRNLCAEKFNIPKVGIYKTYQELLAEEKMADLAIICTNDRLHVEPARMAVAITSMRLSTPL